MFFYRQLDYVANALHRPPLLTFAEEAAGGLAGFAVFPLVYLVAIRFPLRSNAWRVNLLVHLVAVCLISVVHTTLIALLRHLFFPLLGYGNEGYGSLPVRYPMEGAHLFIYYWIIVSLIYFFHEVRFAREREVHQAKLESNLAEAQLQNLRLQLEPHFLFNALNAISAVIYEDPQVADEMLGRLGALLRHVLTAERSQLVPLHREIESLQLYTRIMEARLEERLSVNIQIDGSAQQALVPQLILQPLVENAIRHGMDSTFHVRILIDGRRDGNSLRLIIRDHGPGLNQSKPAIQGVGLRNTIDRLRQLFGDQQSFSISNSPGGGAMVEICLPWKQGDGVEPTTTTVLVAESRLR